jgi:hypothetical protein
MAKYYVLAVEGGINPELSGPFVTEAERDAAGAQIARAQDAESDMTFAADVDDQGNLSVLATTFSADEGRETCAPA